MERKTGYIAGVALILQSIPHAVMFIVTAAKKNKFWKTFLPIACLELVLGVLLVIPHILHELDKIRMVDAVWGGSGDSIRDKAKKKNHRYYFDEPFGFASDFQIDANEIDETNIPEDETGGEIKF